MSLPLLGAGKGVTAVVPFEPEDLGSDLFVWLRAEDLSDGAVSSWAAHVGTCTLTQGTADNQPTKAATSFNSAYPGITFVTASHNAPLGDWLMTETQGSIPVGTTPSMQWIVCLGTAETDARIPIAVSGSAGHRRIVQNANESMTVHDNSLNASNGSASSLVGNHILCGSWGATEIRGYLDGVGFGPTAATLDTGTFTRMRVAAGALPTPANICNTVVSDVFITNVLSQTNREKLEGWIAHNRGLTANLDASHPYKSAAP